MLEIYKEKYYEIFNPHDAKVVAHFFNKKDSKAYLEWRNKKVIETHGTEPEDFAFIGVGLVVSETGELGLIMPNPDSDDHLIVQLSDTEARNLAAMIDAVLA